MEPCNTEFSKQSRLRLTTVVIYSFYGNSGPKWALAFDVYKRGWPVVDIHVL